MQKEAFFSKWGQWTIYALLVKSSEQYKDEAQQGLSKIALQKYWNHGFDLIEFLPLERVLC